MVAPCIESATVDGVAFTGNTGSGTDEWFLNLEDLGDAYFLQWTSHGVAPNSGGGVDLGTQDRTFEAVVRTGSYVPAYVQGRGKGMSADRDIVSGEHYVTISSSPTLVPDGGHECDPGCGESSVAEQEDHVVNAFIDDMSGGGWNPDELAAWYGTDNFSNIYSVTPLQVDYDLDNNLYVHAEFQNPHFHTDGTTLFKGNAHLTFPAAALKRFFGLDDPSSLTSSSMVATADGSTTKVDVTVINATGALVMDVTNMTFSKRAVKLKAGKLTPTRPTQVDGHRLTAATAKVTYHPATPRGSKVRGYVATCVAGDGSHSKTGTSDAGDRRVVVRHLHSGVGYDCRVRATSHAGKGTRSHATHVAAHA